MPQQDNDIFSDDIVKFYMIPYYWFKLRREIKRGIATSRTYLQMSLIYSELGFKKKSFLSAIKALKKDKTNPLNWYAVGASRRELDKVSFKCKKYFLKAFELSGEKSYIPLYDLIVCEAGEYNPVMRNQYEQMFFRMKFDDAGYLLRRAHIFIGHAKIKEAITDYLCSVKTAVFKHSEIDPGWGSFLNAAFQLLQVLWLKTYSPEVLELSEAGFLLEIGKEKAGVDLMLSTAEKFKNKSAREACYKNALSFFYSRDEYKKCIDVANRILIKEKCAEVYGYKGFSYRELGDFQKAREAFHKAREYGSSSELSNSSYYNALALTYFTEGDYRKALNFLNQQIINEPAAHPFLYKGFCLEELNEFDKAIKAYNKSIEFQPDDLAFYRVAILYYLQNDYNNALKSINQGLLLKKDAYNYFLKGDILIALKRIKEAKICYKLAEGLQ